MAVARKRVRRLVAVLYARRSRKVKGRRITSTETQLATGRDYAEEHEWDLWHQEFVDPDTSAYRDKNGKLKNRPGWLGLASAIRSGQIDIVVVWDVNRLTRDTEVGIEFAKLCAQYGVDVVDVNGNYFKLSKGRGTTDYTDFVAMCNAAERDSAAKSEVVTRELGTAAREGSPAGGPPGFGFRRINRTADTEPSLVLVDEEAFLLRRAITTILEGGSLRDGCNIVRPLWPKVRPNSLRKTLLAPRIAGQRQIVQRNAEGEAVSVEYFHASWTPIVDFKTWERLVEILTDEERRNVGRPAEYLLTGGTVETACGGRLHARAQGKEHRRQYRCGSDFCCSRDKEVLEEFVTALVFETVDNGVLARLAAQIEAGDAQAARIAAKRRELRAKKERLIDLAADGLITKAQLAQRQAKVDADLAKLVVPARQGQVIPEAETFAQWWADATLDAKRWLITSLFRIVVHPSTVRGSRWYRPIDPIEVEPLV